VIFYHGCLKAGGTVVNFNPLYTESEIARQIGDSGTDFMVTLDLELLLSKATAVLDRTGLSKVIVASLADQLPAIKGLVFRLAKVKQIAAIPGGPAHVPAWRLLANDGVFSPPPLDQDSAIAVLQYTGGTTGVPKAAALTHANVYANAMQCKAWFYSASGPDNRVVGVLPLFHAFAMTSIMNWTLSVGGCMFLEPRFDAKALLRLIHRKRPTALAGVPTLFTALMATPGFDDVDFGSLKFCISGGAPLPQTIRDRFEEKTGIGIWEGYGLSEASPVCSVNPMHIPSRPGSAGLPLPQTVCEIVALEDGTTVLPPGRTGEICFRGPQVMQGYWNNPAATADTIRAGRLHTGDVGHLDEDGFIYVTDRLKDMIIASGFKIYPRLVEEAIYEHPAVEECAVYGVDDDYRGQTVKAVICLKSTARMTAGDLDRFLESRLSHIEKPKIYEFRGALPKTAVGKIHKKALIDEDKMKHQTVPKATS
jgi:long-chain acyl-CoA synthetase